MNQTLPLLKLSEKQTTDQQPNDVSAVKFAEAQAHTPGPWTAQITKPRRGNRHGDVMICAGGVAAIDANQSGDTFAECAANARLIAAAPDMLAALQTIIGDDGPHDPGMKFSDRMALVRTAIARATGAAS